MQVVDHTERMLIHVNGYMKKAAAYLGDDDHTKVENVDQNREENAPICTSNITDIV